MATNDKKVIPLTQAAQRLKVRYGAVWDDVLRGQLVGEQRDGRWFVTAESVSRLERQRKKMEGSPRAA